MIAAGADAGGAVWRSSLAAAGAAALARGLALVPAWENSRLWLALSTPIPERPAGVSGSALRRAASGVGHLLDRLHGLYRAARPRSAVMALCGRLGVVVTRKPAAAAGVAAAGAGTGYLVSQALLPVLIPSIRCLDLGGAVLGPHGLTYPLPLAVPAGLLAAAAVLVLAQRFWTPRAGSWPCSSLSCRLAADVLFLDGQAGGQAERGGGTGGAGSAAATGAGARGPAGACAGAPAAAAAAAAAGAAVPGAPAASSVYSAAVWPYLATGGLLAGSAAYMLSPARFLLAAAAAGGLLLAFVSTEWYLVALCAALPFVSNEALLAMLGLSVVSLFGRVVIARDRAVSAATPAAGPLMAYAAVVVFATASSVTVLGSLPDLAVQLSALSLVLVMLAVTDRPAVVLRFAAAAVLGLGLQSLIGVYQYAAGVPIEKAWVDLAHEPALSVRVMGSFGNPNVFAEYLVLLLPLAVALFLCARSRLVRLGWLTACSLGAVALVLTFSRGGWVGLAAGVLSFAVIRDRRLLVLVLAGALVIAALPGGQNLIARRLQSIIRPTDSSSVYRVMVWRETLGMIEDFWPSGVGLGHRAYMLMYPRYMLDRTKRPFHSHSTYLQVLAETGLPGLIALLWVVWRVVRTGLASLRKLAGRPAGDPLRGTVAPLIAGALAGLAGAAVHGVVEPLLYIPRITVTFWLVVGLLLCAGKVVLGPGTQPEPVRP